MVVRNVQEKDAIMLNDLLEQLEGKKSDFYLLREKIRMLSGRPEYGLFGAFEGSQMIGFVMGICCQDVCTDCRRFLVIENLIVDREYRGQQVAVRLFEELEEWSLDKDCYYSILVSGKARERAHGFYEKMGYEKEAGYRKYYFEEE